MAAPTTRDQRGERAGWGDLYLFVVIFLPLTILVDVDTDLKLPIPPPPNAVDENEVMPPWPREPKDGNPVGGEERGEAGPPAAVTRGSRTGAAPWRQRRAAPQGCGWGAKRLLPTRPLALGCPRPRAPRRDQDRTVHLYPTGKPSLPQDGKPDLLTSLQHEHGEQKPQSLQSSSSLRKNVTHTYLKQHWGGG